MLSIRYTVPVWAVNALLLCRSRPYPGNGIKQPLTGKLLSTFRYAVRCSVAAVLPCVVLESTSLVSVDIVGATAYSNNDTAPVELD